MLRHRLRAGASRQGARPPWAGAVTTAPHCRRAGGGCFKRQMGLWLPHSALQPAPATCGPKEHPGVWTAVGRAPCEPSLAPPCCPPSFPPPAPWACTAFPKTDACTMSLLNPVLLPPTVKAYLSQGERFIKWDDVSGAGAAGSRGPGVVGLAIRGLVRVSGLAYVCGDPGACVAWPGSCHGWLDKQTRG